MDQGKKLGDDNGDEDIFFFNPSLIDLMEKTAVAPISPFLFRPGTLVAQKYPIYK